MTVANKEHGDRVWACSQSIQASLAPCPDWPAKPAPTGAIAASTPGDMLRAQRAQAGGRLPHFVGLQARGLVGQPAAGIVPSWAWESVSRKQKLSASAAPWCVLAARPGV